MSMPTSYHVEEFYTLVHLKLTNTTIPLSLHFVHFDLLGRHFALQWAAVAMQ